MYYYIYKVLNIFPFISFCPCDFLSDWCYGKWVQSKKKEKNKNHHGKSFLNIPHQVVNTALEKAMGIIKVENGLMEVF